MSSSGGSNECRKSPESHSQPKSKSIKTQRKAIHRMQSEENNKESVTSTTEDHAQPGVRKDAAAEFLEFDDCVDVAAESVEVIVVTGAPVEEGFDVGVEAALFAVLDWPAAAVEEAMERGVNYLYWGSIRRRSFGEAIRNRLAQRDRMGLVSQS